MKTNTLAKWVFVGICSAQLAGNAQQSYFEENFDDKTTESLTSAGWDFGKNDTATETGTEFVVAPPYATADPATGEGGEPGGDFSDPATGENFLYPPTTDGTQSSGKYLISDSDAAGGSDDIGSEAEFWATTSSFSTVGSTEAWFHADAEIEGNNNGEAVADLMASIDGGETWIPMWQMAEPQRPAKSYLNDIEGSEIIGGYPQMGSYSQTKTWSGIHGRWHVKLPEEANNQPDVRIRIRWYEPADAWWIALDNIVVDDNPPPMGSEVVFLEDFEDGIPETWTNTALGVVDKVTWTTGSRVDDQGNLWKVDASGDGVEVDFLRHAELLRTRDQFELPEEALLSFTLDDVFNYPDLEIMHPNGILDGRFIMMMAGGNYAMWQPFFEDDEASNLDSPSLDLSGYSEVFLDFDSEMLPYSGNTEYDVFVSVDGGQNYSRIFTYQGALMDRGEASYFTHHYIPVPEAAGKSDVKFRFYATGSDPDNFRGFWVVDNVRVTGNTAAVGGPADVAIARDGDTITLTWEGAGALEKASSINGPWTGVDNAASPHTVQASDTQAFYRVR